MSVSGTTITYTKGNGSTGTITTKDTTYSTFKGATASAAGNTGLVPAPAKGANTKFLRGDGTWQVAGEVTGVKGDAESSYRVGDVNLTAANVNAISTNTNDSKYGQLTVYPDKNATDNWQYISALTVRSGTGDDVAEIQLRSNSISGDSGLYDSLNNSWVVYVPTDRTDETCYFHGTADRAIAANTAITASAADSLYKTLSLTGDVTGNVSLAGTSSATATLTTVVATNAITTDKVKDKAITNAKLGDDVNTIAVSSTQPTDSRVKIWIKI